MGFFAGDLAMPLEPVASGLEWEESACPLCAARRWTPLLEAPDLLPAARRLRFLVVQCQKCGLCFTNPRPGPRAIGRFYPPSYSPHRSNPGRVRWWRRLLAGLWRNDRKVLPIYGGGRLLDFGCGGGSYLRRMHHQGWDVTGVDLAPAAVAEVPCQPRLRALAGSLPHPQLQRAAFDVVTMWHSLEHVHAPLEVLRAAHGLLVADGKLIVAVPNIDSLAFRWFGAAWYGLDLPRHLTHFAPWTLRLMLHRAGFRAGRIRMIRHASWLRASARLSQQQSEGRLWQRWLRRRAPSALAAWYSYLTNQCDCIMVTARKRD